MADRTEAWKEAILIAGGIRPIARALGIGEPSVSEWTQPPPGRVLDIERLTGVSRHRLRPDIFGEPPPDAATEDAP